MKALTQKTTASSLEQMQEAGKVTKTNNAQKGTQKNLRVQRKSSLNNIDSVAVLRLEPSIITLCDCLVNLHLP